MHGFPAGPNFLGFFPVVVVGIAYTMNESVYDVDRV